MDRGSGSLDGRVVLVTGGGRGIGSETAVRAAAEGATVAIHYGRSAEAARRTLERVREAGSDGDCFPADIADGPEAEALVARVLERFGRIDGLVNNAGLTQVGPFLELEPAEWDAVIATDLTAALLLPLGHRSQQHDARRRWSRRPAGGERYCQRHPFRDV
jgi:3-oxoacyl-[acyl-carrier protein] reductase